MQIRMTTIIVLFLSLHFIIGCVTATHTVTTKQSVSKDSDPLKAGKIISLKPEDGQIIVFDQDGGSYDATQKAVIGMTEEQQDVVIPLDQVREVQVEPPIPDFLVKSGNIVAVTPRSGPVVVFNYAGGDYDVKQKAVIGMTEEQQDVVIPLDQVRELRFETQTKEVDVGAVVTGTAVVALLGAAGFLIYVVSTFALAPV